jgi:hypothetical protein
METINRNLLSATLRKAMTEEHLWSHNAAKLLNLNPAYVSMMLNPNSFEKAGITAWKRIEDWSNTNDKLCNYKFPISEPVWKPKEKAEAKDYNIQASRNEKKVNGKKPATDLGGITSKKIEVKYEDIDKFPEKNQPANELIVGELRESANETTRIKVALDIEINLVVNGQRVCLS